MHQVDTGGDRFFIRLGQFQRRHFHDCQQHRRVNRQHHVTPGATNFRLLLHGRATHNPQRLVGEQMANAAALVPSLHVFAIRPADVGSDHPPLRAVHENTGAAAARRDAIVQRPDHVRTENALTRAKHFGVNRVVDQRGERLAVAADCLHHVAARVVKLRSVIVIGNLPVGLAGGDPERRRLQPGDRLVDRLGGFVANEVEILKIRVGAAPAVGEAVAVGCTVRVRRADQNMRGRNGLDLPPHAVTQRGGEAEEVRADERHPRAAVLEHHRPHREVAVFFGDRIGRPNAAGHRQQRLRRDHPHRYPGAKLRVRDRRVAKRDGEQNNESDRFHKWKSSVRNVTPGRQECHQEYSLMPSHPPHPAGSGSQPLPPPSYSIERAATRRQIGQTPSGCISRTVPAEIGRPTVDQGQAAPRPADGRRHTLP